ncbi:MAG: hypothetical protein M3Q30_22255 [Actinomycetota bacterium]|nr:hypothetical protein [Actinomycetota bacterium]
MIGFPESGAQDQRSFYPFPSAHFKCSDDRDSQRHGGWLAALAHQVQHSVSAQRLGVVLDPDRRGFRGTQGVDAEQVSQGAVVHAEGLGHLKESDQFEPVEALGA